MSRPVSALCTAVRTMETLNSEGYVHFPFSCELDQMIGEVLEDVMSLSVAERSEVSAIIAKPFLYLTFSERMAVLAVRENSQTRLWQALLAHVLEDFRWDYRENLMVLSVVYHSAKKIGGNAKELFQRAADLAGPRAAHYLREFGLHPKSIRSMGYREVVAEDGFRYQRDW